MFSRGMYKLKLVDEVAVWPLLKQPRSIILSITS